MQVNPSDSLKNLQRVNKLWVPMSMMSPQVVDKILDQAITFTDYFKVVDAVMKSRRLSKYIKNGYRILGVKFLYGLEMDRDSVPKLGLPYALVTIGKDSYEVLAVFIDVIRGKILKLFNVRNA